MIKEICENCGKEFLRYPSRGKGRFCTRICYQKVWRSITKNPRVGNDSRIKKLCILCGKELSIYPSDEKLGRGKFCSKKCGAFGKKPQDNANWHLPIIPPMLGKKNPNATFKKGMIPWNKGKSIPQMSGKLHPNWKGGISKENDKQRVKFKRYFQKKVLERDNFTCQSCKKLGGYLQVNHKKSWANYPELRFDLNNCETLCQKCHYYLTYGKILENDYSAWGNNFSRRWLP